MLQITQKYLIISISILAFIFSGCASKANFKNTPINKSEFKKDIKVLKATYSDIEKYSRFFSLPSNNPNISELKKIWGKHEENRLWFGYILGWSFNIALVATGVLPYSLLALTAIIVPLPQKEYIWYKNRYRIKARTRNDLFVKYNERMTTWDWKELDK